MIKSYVLDSFAILAYQQGEEGKDEVKKLLRDAEEGKVKLYLNWVNFGEVYYITSRDKGEDAANRAVAIVKNWPLEFVTPDERITLIAAKLKANNPISYADSYAAATAWEKDAEVATGNTEFKLISDVVPVFWIKEV